MTGLLDPVITSLSVPVYQPSQPPVETSCPVLTFLPAPDTPFTSFQKEMNLKWQEVQDENRKQVAKLLELTRNLMVCQGITPPASTTSTTTSSVMVTTTACGSFTTVSTTSQSGVSRHNPSLLMPPPPVLAKRIVLAQTVSDTSSP